MPTCSSSITSAIPLRSRARKINLSGSSIATSVLWSKVASSQLFIGFSPPKSITQPFSSRWWAPNVILTEMAYPCRNLQ